MHSNVYVLRVMLKGTKTDFEPATESDFQELLVPHTADYILEYKSTEWFKELQWLCDCYDCFNIAYNEQKQLCLTINIEKAIKFLQDTLDKLKEKVEELTLKDFIMPYNSTVYDIEEIMNNKFGFRFLLAFENDIWFDHYNLNDMLKSIVNCFQKETTATLRVEGIFDYHF